MYTKHVKDMFLNKPSYELSNKQRKIEIKQKKLKKGVERKRKRKKKEKNYINEKRYSNR